MIRRLVVAGAIVSMFTTTASCGGPATRGPLPARPGPLGWLSETWVGKDGNARIEERWSEDADGTLVGAFRVVDGGRLAFVEILTLTRDGDGWVLRMRHFDGALAHAGGKDRVLEYRGANPTGPELDLHVVGEDSVQRIVYQREGATLTITLHRGEATEVFRFEAVSPSASASR